MTIIDISRPTQIAPKYPTAPDTLFTQVDYTSKGDDSNFTVIFTNTHAGTHVDAKRHFIDGARGIGEMDLSIYYGPCRVMTVPENSMLTRADFEGKLDGVERLVMHGGGKTYMKEDAAAYLVQCGLKCLVTDGWSPASLDPVDNRDVHRTLLDGEVGIVENVVLDGVPDGDYTLVAFPVHFGSSDGAPTRAVLLRE